eukprot:6167320-Alexandrium_andersonii.AAC.1
MRACSVDECPRVLAYVRVPAEVVAASAMSMLVKLYWMVVRVHAMPASTHANEIHACGAISPRAFI